MHKDIFLCHHQVEAAYVLEKKNCLAFSKNLDCIKILSSHAVSSVKEMAAFSQL